MILLALVIFISCLNRTEGDKSQPSVSVLFLPGYAGSKLYATIESEMDIPLACIGKSGSLPEIYINSLITMIEIYY